MAAKDNASASQIDKTAFFWTANCAICHPGGGPGEFDRDGNLYYDTATGQFGYEKAGKSAADIALDGDYAFLNPGTGAVSAAPWNKTGVAEPDCLLCHAASKTFTEGKNMNWIWRTATQRAGGALVDSAGASVPAFTAAPAAGQGWFSAFELAETPAGTPPKATTLQIDYSGAIQQGVIVEANDGSISFSGQSLVSEPKDLACWGCHAIADQKKRGRVWFDADQDVHYAAINHLDDDDTSNDVAAADSTACTYCHTSGPDHNLTKGNSFAGSVHDESDYQDQLVCRDCHTDGDLRDPAAPLMPAGDAIHTAGHLAAMACQFCHVPYKRSPAQLVIDNAVTGASVAFDTNAFLSADPLDPTAADTSRWYPGAKKKVDKDGVTRLFPAKLLNTIWWGDWDEQNNLVTPLALWRVRQITGGAALEGVSDDNGDGTPEVNTVAEIRIYIDALQANDSHGNPVATNPVLIKGGHLWYLDTDTDEVVAMELEGSGIKAESLIAFSADHNVLPSSEALGAGANCNACHGASAPTFDRAILIDPYGTDGEPVYETLGDLTETDLPF